MRKSAMFLCFSSGDRYTVVKSCLYHLKNYGIPVWYDYHELILGDQKREKNFEYAIKNNDYFVVIYSKNFFNSPCAIIEEKRIFEELKMRQIIIFPLLYNLTFEELPKKYKDKIENFIYNEIDDKTGTLLSVNQIVTKYLVDKINISSFEATPSISKYDFSNLTDKYIIKLINIYKTISKDNFNAQISILYCLFSYLETKKKIKKEFQYLCRLMSYLFTFTKLNIAFNHKEIIIAELSIILLLQSIS